MRPTLKQKAFRIDAALAAGFEAWCEQKGYVQERVAEALLLWVIATSPQQRDELMQGLADWKASKADEPAMAGGSGAGVAAAVRRARKSSSRPKQRRGRQSA